MAVFTALGGISQLSLHSTIRDDDGVDQLHHFVTVTLLASFAAIAGLTEYTGEPINCWNYGNYQWGHYAQHVNSFCWTHSLYSYPNKKNLSIMPYELNTLAAAEHKDLSELNQGKIGFYRWVTVIFLVQALMFKLPNVIWTEMNTYSGTNIFKMVEILQGILFSETREKEETLQHVALFIEQWLRIHRKSYWFVKHAASSEYVKRTVSCCMACIGSDTSNYLSTLYLVVKALFLLNNIVQFSLLSAFLETNFWEYGQKAWGGYSEIADNLLVSNLFPIVVLCPFQTYHNNAVLQNWVQCLLTMNLLLEKLFLILWLWLLVLLGVTIINFLSWCYKILQTQGALKLVQSYMRIMEFYSVKVPVPNTCSVEEFVTEYLRSDGIFILRILAVNSNEVVVAQLVEELWKRYLEFKVAEMERAKDDLKKSSTAQSEDINTAFSQEDNENVEKNASEDSM